MVWLWFILRLDLGFAGLVMRVLYGGFEWERRGEKG